MKYLVMHEAEVTAFNQIPNEQENITNADKEESSLQQNKK